MKDHISLKSILRGTALAGLLAIGSQGMSAAMSFAGTSVLNSGRWVKVNVKESGVHQITFDQLRSMGFTNPEKVAVYGYSAAEAFADHRLTGESPDGLPQVPVMVSGDRLLFYGEGDLSVRMEKAGVTSSSNIGYKVTGSRNYFASYNSYFLTEVDSPLRPEIVEAPEQIENAVETSFGMCYVEDELTNPGQLGAPFFGPDFSAKGGLEVPVTMLSYEPDASLSDRSKIEFTLRMVIMSDPFSQNSTSSSTYLDLIYPSGNYETRYITSGTEALDTYTSLERAYTDTPEAREDATYPFRIDLGDIYCTYAALDYLSVSYPRTNRLNGVEGETLVFRNISAGKPIRLSNVSDGVMLWDVSDAAAPRVFRQREDVEAEDNAVYIAAPSTITPDGRSGYSYIAAYNSDSEFPTVEFAGEVAGQNLHSAATPQMLIVTNPLFRSEAERLAEAHRRIEGKDVLVADLHEIYNEFSGGTPHAIAIRRFAKMLYDRNPSKFRSILLFGAASWDNRGLTTTDMKNHTENIIPMYQRQDLNGSGRKPESYSTDAYVGMLAENSDAFDIGRSEMTVAVGRIPARTFTEGRAYVDKAIAYLQNPPMGEYRNRALLMSDLGDQNSHMHDAEGIASIISTLSPATTIYKAYNSIYPITKGNAEELNRKASQALAQGVAYWSYSGHATPRFFGSEKIWSVTKSNAETYSVQPFVMLATCRALFYDHNTENIGEAMLYNERGGAIALVGALREVYQEYNQKFNETLATKYFSAEEPTTFGEMFRTARNLMVPTGTVPTGANAQKNYYAQIYNTLSYNLIGDPELMPAMPSRQVALTGIDGRELTDELFEIEAGQMHTFEGVVLDGEGNADTSFNGEVSLNLFDGARTAKVINVRNSSENSYLGEEVNFDEDILVESKLKVTDGRFSAGVYVPVPARQDGQNRLSLYAQNAENASLQASGVHTNLTVRDNAADEVPGEETVPVISSMYLEGESFRNGDLMTGTPTLYATIAPNKYGLTGVSSQIGRSMALFLDGRQVYSAACGELRIDSDGGASLEWPLADVTDGLHTLTIRVANNAGQMASRSLSFTMVNVHTGAQLTVDSECVSENVEINVENWEFSELEGTLAVKDGSGRTVFAERNVSFPYIWHLRDNDNRDVPDGHYTIEAYVHGSQHYGAAKGAAVVVLR